MSYKYPRRRDVRVGCEELFCILRKNYNYEEYAFDKDFLTNIRDLMRDGMELGDALMHSRPAPSPPLPVL